jgi:hypothetical protein
VHKLTTIEERTMNKLIENTVKNAIARLPEGDEFSVVWKPDSMKNGVTEETVSSVDFAEWVRGKVITYGKWFEISEIKAVEQRGLTEYVVYAHRQNGKRQGCLWVTTLLCEKSSLVKPFQTTILEKILLSSNLDTPRILLQQKIFSKENPETITEYSGSISELASLIQKAKQKRFWRLG